MNVLSMKDMQLAISAVLNRAKQILPPYKSIRCSLLRSSSSANIIDDGGETTMGELGTMPFFLARAAVTARKKKRAMEKEIINEQSISLYNVYTRSASVHRT